MNTISFFVEGLPAPKGSGKAVMLPGRNWPVIVNASKHCKPWVNTLSRTATTFCTAKQWGISPHEIHVSLAFFLPRPADHFVGRKKSQGIRSCAPKKHLKKPDLDKLTRLVLDSMTGIAWVDDSQVTEITAYKTYYCHRTGVLICIDEVLP